MARTGALTPDSATALDAPAPSLARTLLWGFARVSSVLVLLVAWEALARSGTFTPFVLPTLSSVIERIWTDALSGELFINMGLTIYRALVGFLIDFLFKASTTAADGSRIEIPASASNGPLVLAAGLSAALGVFSLILPHTPPTGKADDPMPIAKAVGLFRDPSFAVFFTVSFLITIVLAFYYTTTSAFLESAIKIKDTGSTMAIISPPWPATARAALRPIAASSLAP